MKILGIDTSTKTTSLALMDGDIILGETNFYSNMDHSEKLIDNLNFLLDSCDLTIDDIDLIAVAVGPGSFTGIRIGLATVMGLNEFKNKPVAPVSSLKILARNLKEVDKVAVAVDAKRNRVYGYIVDNKNKTTILEEGLYDLEEFKDQLSDDMLVTGDMNEEFSAYRRTSDRDLINYGSNLCILGKEVYEAGQSISHMELRANYMAKSQAEMDKKEKRDHGQA